jgi:hypothetical protein
MRAYFFNNMYQGGIFTGIQAGHAIDQIWSKYVEKFFAVEKQTPSEHFWRAFNTLREFSKDHKTFIVLNGGDHRALWSLTKLLDWVKNPYPWHYFTEEGLNDAITSVGIVIPESLYDQTATIVGKECVQDETALECFIKTGVTIKGTDGTKPEHVRTYTEFDLEFLKRRVVCSLAK